MCIQKSCSYLNVFEMNNKRCCLVYSFVSAEGSVDQLLWKEGNLILLVLLLKVFSGVGHVTQVCNSGTWEVETRKLIV